MSFSSTSSGLMSPYASSLSSLGGASDGTRPSSVHSSSRGESPRSRPARSSTTHSSPTIEEQHWCALQAQTNELMYKLLQAKRESETLQCAWTVRCQTLEEEVSRLARMTAHLDEERRELVRQLAVARTSGPTSYFNPFEDEKTPSGTRCIWTGTEWRPIASDSALARSETPQIDPTKSMSKQDPPPCNSHYLNGNCTVPRCKFSHLYKLTPTQVEEMRRGAKFHLCNALKNGVKCEDPLCCYGHCCPRGSACGRTNCAFNDEQHRAPPAASLFPVRPTPRRC